MSAKSKVKGDNVNVMGNFKELDDDGYWNEVNASPCPQLFDEVNVRKAYVYFKIYALAYEKWKEFDQSSMWGDGTSEVKWFTAEARSMYEIAERKHAKISELEYHLGNVGLSMLFAKTSMCEKLRALEEHDKVWVESVDEVKAVAFLKSEGAFTLGVYTRDESVSTALSEKEIEHHMAPTPTPTDPPIDPKAFRDFCQALVAYQALRKKNERLMVKRKKAVDAFERAKKSYQKSCNSLYSYKRMSSQKTSSIKNMTRFSGELLNYTYLFLDEVKEVEAMNHFIKENKYKDVIHLSDGELKKNLKHGLAKICICNPTVFVKELKDAVASLVKALDDCSHLCNDIQSIGNEYRPSAELTDFIELPDPSSVSQNHPWLDPFRGAIWITTHPDGQPMPGEEQEDILMTSTDSSILNPYCPLTGKPVTRLAEPVRSMDCKHIYDKEAVMGYIRSNVVHGRCPVTGCRQILYAEKVVCDPFLPTEIDEARSLNEQRARDEIKEDFTEVKKIGPSHFLSLLHSIARWSF